MRPRPGRRILSRLFLFGFTSALCGVLVAGLVLPVAGVVGLAARTGAESFEGLPSDLETPPLPQRSRILDADGRVLAQFYYENRVSVPLSKVAPVMRKAMVAIEDSRFYQHGGVDVRGTLRAFVNNQSGESTQGGSTLTQQYVKLVLLENALDSGDPSRAEQVTTRSGVEGYMRKLRELRYAIALEDRFTKDQILERYLNIAYFGSGAYGVEAAARHYFRKPARLLAASEAATLAGLVQSPGRYDPTRNPRLALQRRDVVLDRMAQLGLLTPRQAAKSQKAKLGLEVSSVPNGCSRSMAPFFCDYVVNTVLTDPAFGETREERQRLLLRGGLVIRTTLDRRIQSAAQKAVDSNIPRRDASGLGTAIAMVQPGTGKILAMAQNRTWGTEKKRGVTTINYAVDKSLGGGIGFQAGSTFKPFTAAAAIDQGIPMSLRLYSPSRKTFTGFENCETGAPFPAYSPANSTTSGTFDMRQGLAFSVNTWAVGLEERTGLCAPVNVARSLGVHRADGTSMNRVPSWTLGTEEVAPLSMAEAYATFAARGKHCPSHAISQVVDRRAKLVPRKRTVCKQVLEPAVADAVNYLLEGVVDFGTGQRMDLGRPTAGKTGTTSENKDVWFVGHTPNMAAAVWVGDPGTPGRPRRPMRDIEINGERISAAAGSTVAGPIWLDAMEAAVDELPPLDFVTPDPTVVRGAAVEVPDVRGMTQDQAMATLEAVGLFGRVGPETFSNFVPEGLVAFSAPGVGSSAYSGGEVVLYISSGAPPPPPPPAPSPEPQPSERARPSPTPSATASTRAPAAKPRPRRSSAPTARATRDSAGGEARTGRGKGAGQDEPARRAKRGQPGGGR